MMIEGGIIKVAAVAALLSLVASCAMAAEQTTFTKCGRDASFYLLRELGKDVTLDEVDFRLQWKNEVSARELVDLFTRYGLDCQLSVINRQSAEQIQRYLDANPEHVRAIVAVPPAEGERSIYHFAPLVRISASGAEFRDLAGNKNLLLPFWKVSEGTTIPVLVVARPRSLSAGTSYSLQRAFDSPWLLIAFTISVIVMVLPRAFASLSRLLWRNAKFIAPVLALATPLGLLVTYRDALDFSKHYEIVGAGQDLGRIPIGAKERFVLRVPNRGRDPLAVRIEEITCACVSVVPESIELAPGEEGRFAVDVKPTVLGESRQHILFAFKTKNGSVTRQPAEVKMFGITNESVRPTHVNLGPVPQKTLFMTTIPVSAIGEDFAGQHVSVRSLVEAEHALEVRLPDDFVLGTDGRIPISVSAGGGMSVGGFMQQIVLTIGEQPKQVLNGEAGKKSVKASEFLLTLYGESVPPLYLCSEHSRITEMAEAEVCVRAQPGTTHLLESCVVVEGQQPLTELQRDRDEHSLRIRVRRQDTAARLGSFAIQSGDGQPLSRPAFVHFAQKHDVKPRAESGFRLSCP